MPKTYGGAESVQIIADGLIANYHPELATARIMYVFVDTSSNKGGLELSGKVRKFSGFLEFALEKDFVVEVALDKWNDLLASQRTALIDHLLERCTGEEDEETGAMKWKIREPTVQEFTTVLHRQGAWHEGLQELVATAKGIDVEEIMQQECGNLEEGTQAASE
jgi:hypothetical protein